MMFSDENFELFLDNCHCDGRRRRVFAIVSDWIPLRPLPREGTWSMVNLMAAHASRWRVSCCIPRWRPTMAGGKMIDFAVKTSS